MEMSDRERKLLTGLAEGSPAQSSCEVGLFLQVAARFIIEHEKRHDG